MKHCTEDHHREFAALKELDLPSSQRNEARHVCAACAYAAGYLAALVKVDALMDPLRRQMGQGK